jgi:hypothetical protein
MNDPYLIAGLACMVVGYTAAGLAVWKTWR